MPEEKIVTPDPVAEPEAYQKALLELLGDQDLEAVLAATPERVAELTDELDLDTLQRRPEPGEWSAEEILGHLFDAEVVYSFRWRFTLAENDPVYPGYDQDAWIKLPRPSFPELLAAFASLRRANVWLVEETPTEQWTKDARHSERGSEPFGTSLALVAGHDLAHLKQLEQTVAAVTE
ncbi:MAG TPA: DinB family protein [Actinomycetota bacterium]|nr:DinB family protein [Actinomycetota bacterium]